MHILILSILRQINKKGMFSMKKFILAGIFFIFVSAANFANAAEIDRVFYFGNSEISYPLVIAKNDDATAKINKVIRAEVKKFFDGLKDSQNNIGGVGVDYEIPCNHENGILSVVLTEYVYFEGAAHPLTWKRGLNFNSDSGARLTADTLSEIAKHGNDYTPAELTRKLKAYSKKNNLPLSADFQELTVIPEDFYFDDNLHVHFIFQQYEVAPYAAGIIDLDADLKY